MIYLLILIIITGFVLSAILFHITTKIFKVVGANYKTDFIIFTLQCIFSLIVGALFGIILAIFNFQSLNIILAILINAIIFHKFLQKYYQTSLKKNIAIYTVFTIVTFIVFFTITIFMRSFVVTSFLVRGDAMNPIYQDGDYFLVNEITKNYKRGDVIVFRYPRDTREFFIKRIIGLPGEKVEIKNGQITIYNQKHPKGFTIDEYYLPKTTFTSGNLSIQLKNDEYFVMGDNREHSYDSRRFGPVKRSLIIGKVTNKIWSNIIKKALRGIN